MTNELTQNSSADEKGFGHRLIDREVREPRFAFTQRFDCAERFVRDGIGIPESTDGLIGKGIELPDHEYTPKRAIAIVGSGRKRDESTSNIEEAAAQIVRPK